jgi:hypothetical protein
MEIGLVLLTAAMVAGLGTAGWAGGAGVAEARVASAAGVPRLLLDGRPTVPFIFFYNTDIGGPEREHLLRSQMQLVMAAGCHIYSLPLRVPRLPESNEANFAYPDGLLDRFIAIDPEALFLVRVYPGPDRSWRLWRDLPAGEIATFADGSQGGASLSSEVYQREFAADLRAMIRHFEGGPYGRRIIAYQPGGPEHEMFGDQYREKGPDRSLANQQGFQRWLAARYGSDAALQQAWGQPEVTLTAAAIPAAEPGRFPMHGGDQPARIFYDLPAQRDWVDYSAYCNDLAADCIIQWARLIKAETSGRKLSAFFYGYTMELIASFSGHYRVQRVLDCPEVDILAGPCSYSDRRGGDPASFMSLVDTITAHGKLWFNEDDSRTSLLDPAYMREEWRAFNESMTATDLEETLTVLERNFTAIEQHRAGTWWMDLFAAGAFNHPRAGELLQRLMARYAAELPRLRPFRPQVAVIVDERSKEYVRSDWDANYWTMVTLRTAMGKCGRDVGWYSLADFVAGVVPACRCYVFANAFCLDAGQREAMAARLRRERARAIWVYAPGYLGPDGPDMRQTRQLTGLQVRRKAGTQGSTGTGLLAGLSWGAAVEVRPRLVVTEPNAEVLGHYRADGLASAARTQAPGYDSIFLADTSLSAEVLQRLLAAK